MSLIYPNLVFIQRHARILKSIDVRWGIRHSCLSGLAGDDFCLDIHLTSASNCFISLNFFWVCTQKQPHVRHECHHWSTLLCWKALKSIRFIWTWTVDLQHSLHKCYPWATQVWLKGFKIVITIRSYLYCPIDEPSPVNWFLLFLHHW